MATSKAALALQQEQEKIKSFIKAAKTLEVDLVANDLKAWNDAFQYAGFDYVHLIKLVFKRLEGKYKDETDKIRIVYKCVYLFLKRGSRIDNIIAKSVPTAKVQLDEIKKVFNLQNEVKNKRGDLTLSRVASLFPIVVMELMPSITDHVVNPAAVEHYFNVKSYPLQFCNIAMLSVVPLSLEGAKLKILLNAGFMVSSTLHSIIKGKKPSGSEIENIEKFAMFAYKSIGVSAIERKTLSEKYGIFSSSGAIHESIVQASIAYETFRRGSGLAAKRSATGDESSSAKMAFYGQEDADELMETLDQDEHE